MYYEELDKIEITEDITGEDVKKLDEWLVRTPYRNRKNLKPDNFAEAEGLEEGKALRLFLEAFKVKVLGVRFRVVDDKGKFLEEYEKLKDVPKTVYSEKKSKEIEVNGENTLLIFSLVARSTQSPALGKGLLEILQEMESEQ